MQISQRRSKTKVLLFATHQQRAKNNFDGFSVKVEGTELKTVETARLLGVELSSNFSWDIHADEIIKECSGRINGLYKVQHILDKKQKKSLVEGLILSKIHYAIEIVSSSSKHIMKKLEGMKSKAARYVLGKSRTE